MKEREYFKKALHLSCACFVSGVALPSLAMARETSSEQVAGVNHDDEIIVTAQKRAETLLEVPATIAAFDDRAIKRNNATTLENLAVLVSSVQFSTNEGKGQASIRGIGNQFVIGAGEAAVATHVDGFYVPRQSGIVGSFLDVERVEVLKGPQGTLYGRNATAGTINIINNKPGADHELTMALEGLYIDRGDGAGHGYGVKASAVANVPINDAVRTRLSVMKVSRDGYFNAVYPGNRKVDIVDADEIYLRAQLAADLADNVDWLIATDNYWADDRGAFINIVGRTNPDLETRGVELGYLNGGRTRLVYLDKPISNTPKQNAFTSTLSWQASDAVTIKSLTQYRYNRYHMKGEFDSTQAPISENDYHVRSRAISQEFQALVEMDKIKLTSGLFYFQEKNKIYQFFYLPETLRALGITDTTLYVNGSSKTKAYAAYADLTYSLMETLDVTIGGRYSIEDRSGQQDFQLYGAGMALGLNNAPLPKKRFKAFTPKAVINYRPNDDMTFFVSAQKGFKSGGYNIGSPNQNTPFKPEKIKALEVGAKTRFLDRKLGLNLSVFIYKYSDLQVEDTEDVNTVIKNAAGAKIKGIELEGFARPIDGLRFDFNMSVLDAKFTKGLLLNPIYPEEGPVPIKGNRLFRSSKYSGTVSASYEHAMASGATISPVFTASYRSKQFFTAFNDPLVSQKGYWWLRASLAYTSPDKSWSASVYGDNLTNVYALTSGAPSAVPYGSPMMAGTMPPRTYGIRFEHRF